MNDKFVCIKVDREERPDLDQIYQLAVQLLGRSGGWPLTVFLTPDQKPFFAGTYFPPVERHGMPSFPHVLLAVSEAYREKRADIDAQAREIAGAIDERGPPRAAKRASSIPSSSRRPRRASAPASTTSTAGSACARSSRTR